MRELSLKKQANCPSSYPSQFDDRLTVFSKRTARSNACHRGLVRPPLVCP
jgi:hypothetical protein